LQIFFFVPILGLGMIADAVMLFNKQVRSKSAVFCS